MKIKTKLIAALALACAFTGGAGILKASAADYPAQSLRLDFDGDLPSNAVYDGLAPVAGGVGTKGWMISMEGAGRVEVNALPYAEEGYTFSAWAKIGSKDNRLFSVDTENGTYSVTAGGFKLEGDDGVAADGTQSDGAYVYGTDTAEKLVSSDWHYITAVITDSELRFYQDTELCYIHSASRLANVKFFKGMMAELRKGTVYIGSSQQELDTLCLDEVTFSSQPVYVKGDMLRLMSVGSHSADIQAVIQGMKGDSSLPAGAAPLLHYTFDEDADRDSAGGNVVSFANQGTRTTAGSEVQVGGLDLGSYIADGKVHLSGKQGYVKLPENMFKNVSEFTLSFDFQREVPSRNDCMIYMSRYEGPHTLKADGGSTYYESRLQAFNGVFVPSGATASLCHDLYANRDAEQSTGCQYTKMPIWSDTAWHTYTCTFKGGTMSVYMDGLFIVSSSNSVDLQAYVYNFIGGTSYDAASKDPGQTVQDAFFDRDFFKGSIDNILFYDYVADAGQIAAFTHNVEEVVVDLPSGASSVGDNYAVNFNKYGTSFTPDFSGIDISRSGVSYVQHPYTRAMYPVRVVVRDPVNAEKSVTADYLTRNALPDLYEFAYSDGSKETLALSWDKKYAYSETAVLYTGTATDSSGRKASLKLTVTGKIGESDLTELIAETEKILSSQEYVASTQTAFGAAVKKSLAAAKAYAGGAAGAEYKRIYVALADDYLSVADQLLSSAEIKTALEEFVADGFDEYCDEEAVAEYADAYKEVQDLLSEADSAEEIAEKIEVLAQKYGKLNVLRKYLGLVGDVVTDKGGYKLQIPQTGSDNVNLLATNYLTGEFTVEFDALYPDFVENQLSYSALSFNAQHLNIGSIRYFGEWYSADVKPTSLLRIDYSDYILMPYQKQMEEINLQNSLKTIDLRAKDQSLSALTGAEKEKVQAEMKILEAEIAELTRQYRELDEMVKQLGRQESYILLTRDEAVHIVARRMIDGDRSYIEVTLSQSTFEPVVYVIDLDGYKGGVQVVWGGYYSGCNIENLVVKGTPRERGTQTFEDVYGNAQVTEEKVSVAAGESFLTSGESSQDFIAGVDFHLEEIGEKGALYVYATDATGLVKDTFAIDLKTGKFSSLPFGADEAAEEDTEITFKAGRYAVTLARQTGDKAVYNLMIADASGKMLFKSADLKSTSLNDVCFSFGSSDVKFAAENYKNFSISKVVELKSYDPKAYSKNSIDTFVKKISALDTSVEGMAAMNATEFEELVEKLEDARKYLRPSVIESYTKPKNVTVSVGDDLTKFIYDTVRVTYTSGYKATLSVKWGEWNTDKNGTFVLKGIVKDYDGSDYEVELTYIVGTGINEPDDSSDSGSGSHSSTEKSSSDGGGGCGGCKSAAGFSGLAAATMGLAMILRGKKRD